MNIYIYTHIYIQKLKMNYENQISVSSYLLSSESYSHSEAMPIVVAILSSDSKAEGPLHCLQLLFLLVRLRPTRIQLPNHANCATIPQLAISLIILRLIFPFHLLPFPVHPAGFSFYILPGFPAIIIWLPSNNNNINNG